MAKKFDIKKSIITALFISLCVVLPMAFHLIQISGSIFCPMHIPVLLCGLICGWKLGLICGLTGPLLSCLLTGMPSVTTLPAMTVELSVYGLITGLMMTLVHTKRIYTDLYASLITAMLAGRIAAGIIRALTFMFFTYVAADTFSISVWTTSYFITSFPGIVTHLIIIPSIVFALTKARLIPTRYPKGGYKNG